MCQQAIARVPRGEGWARARALTIGGAGNEFSKQGLHVPMQVVLKMQRQPIEQLGMTGLFADAAKIFLRLNDSGAEELLPIAVHRRACSQGLVGGEEPSGERQAIVRCSGRKLG